MTRINAGIKIQELCNDHLFSEYREMKRIPNKVKAGIYNDKTKIPDKFCLNTGHEIFFKNKILYLKRRSDALYQELLKRNYKVEDYSSCYEDIPPHLYNDWQETEEARELLKERINSRLKSTKKTIKFYDKVIVDLEEILIK